MALRRTAVSLIGVLGTVVFGLGLSGAAQEPEQASSEGIGKSRSERHLEWMQKELDLSESQANEIRALHARDSVAEERGRKERAAREELEALLDAPEPDRAVIAEKVRSLSELRSQALEARIDHHFALQQILTPEQRAKLKAGRDGRSHYRGYRLRNHWRGRSHGRDAQPPSEVPKP